LFGRLRLQDDQTVGELERFLRRGGLVDIAIHVGAGEGDDERPVARKALDRLVAAAGVEGEHRVGAVTGPLHRYPYAVAGFAQERRPAQRGMPVSVARAGACGRHQRNFHSLDWQPWTWSNSSGRRARTLDAWWTTSPASASSGRSSRSSIRRAGRSVMSAGSRNTGA